MSVDDPPPFVVADASAHTEAHAAARAMARSPGWEGGLHSRSAERDFGLDRRPMPVQLRHVRNLTLLGPFYCKNCHNRIVAHESGTAAEGRPRSEGWPDHTGIFEWIDPLARVPIYCPSRRGPSNYHQP